MIQVKIKSPNRRLIIQSLRCQLNKQQQKFQLVRLKSGLLRQKKQKVSWNTLKLSNQNNQHINKNNLKIQDYLQNYNELYINKQMSKSKQNRIKLASFNSLENISQQIPNKNHRKLVSQFSIENEENKIKSKRYKTLESQQYIKRFSSKKGSVSRYQQNFTSLEYQKEIKDKCKMKKMKTIQTDRQSPPLLSSLNEFINKKIVKRLKTKSSINQQYFLNNPNQNNYHNPRTQSKQKVLSKQKNIIQQLKSFKLNYQQQKQKIKKNLNLSEIFPNLCKIQKCPIPQYCSTNKNLNQDNNSNFNSDVSLNFKHQKESLKYIKFRHKKDRIKINSLFEIDRQSKFQESILGPWINQEKQPINKQQY